MAAKQKSFWILMLFLLSGIVIRWITWRVSCKVDFLWWLGYGESFGLASPIELNLKVISITFGLMFKINIASIIGMGIAVYIYRKI